MKVYMDKVEEKKDKSYYMVTGMFLVILTLTLAGLLLSRALNVSQWNSDFKSFSENENEIDNVYDIHPLEKC